jgi:hypothetical protein
MKISNCFLFLLLISSGLLMLTGCNLSTGFVLSDDVSLKKLNELENERALMITTLDSIYIGQNIKITRDSTTLENISIKPNSVSYLFVIPTKDITRIQRIDKEDAYLTRVAMETPWYGSGNNFGICRCKKFNGKFEYGRAPQ